MKIDLLKGIIVLSLSTTAMIGGSLAVQHSGLEFGKQFAGQVSDAVNDEVRERIAKDLNGRETTIQFFGDMMLDRHVRALIDDSDDKGSCDYPFSIIDPVLGKADLRVVNMEGPLTSNDSVSIKNNGMRFTQPMKCLIDIAERFQVIGLANNHMSDFGSAGYAETKRNLTLAGIKYFGDYYNSASTYYIKEINGYKIAFFGWNESGGGGTKTTVADIKKVKEKGLADFIIVLPHWGVEYKTVANDNQRKAATDFINAGADLIVGSHPHVVQGAEQINGKPVFYSLGNFVFDQYFDEEVMKGLSIKLTLRRNKTEGIDSSYKLVPIKITKNSQPYEVDEDEAKKVFQTILNDSPNATEIFKAELQNGEFYR